MVGSFPGGFLPAAAVGECVLCSAVKTSNCVLLASMICTKELDEPLWCGSCAIRDSSSHLITLSSVFHNQIKIALPNAKFSHPLVACDLCSAAA